MKIAVVSQGPSARAYPGNDGYDVVIAVNGQAERVACDVWVYADAAAFVKWRPLNEPTHFCRANVPRDLLAFGVHELIRWQMAPSFLQETLKTPLWLDVPGWNEWSGLAAFGLASQVQPKAIDLYGFDMDGNGDVAGGVEPSRTPERWAKERETFERLWTLIGGRGVALQRILG